MDFAREFRFLASKKVAGFLVTVPLAMLLHSYWALVAGVVAGRVAGVILSYCMQPYRPRLGFAARRELFSFSYWLLINNTIGFGTARLSHFVVGRLYGSSALGAYTLGAEIAMLPATELAAPLNRAVFPAYARMASDAVALRQGFLDVFGVTAVVVLPASVGIAAVADPVVRAFLGSQWDEAISLVEILAFCGVVHVLLSNSYSAYLALGRTHVLPLLGGIRLATLIPLLALLGYQGMVGVAYAELGAAFAMYVASHALLVKTFGISTRAYLANLWRPLMAAAFMAATVLAALNGLAGLAPPVSPALQLLAGVLIGVAAYVAALTILWLSCGRPAGPEATVMVWSRETATRFLRNARRSTLRG